MSIPDRLAHSSVPNGTLISAGNSLGKMSVVSSCIAVVRGYHMRMRIRSLLCSVILLSVLSGASDGIITPASQAHAARVIVKQPGAGRRAVELGIRLPSVYYGYGWAGRFYDYGFGYYYDNYAAGPGIQLLVPLVPNVGRAFNNTFYLGFFTDFLIHSYYDVCGRNCNYYAYSLAFGPMAQWRVFLLDLFTSGGLSVFTNFGFGLWPWFANDGFHGFGFFPLFQLGANLMFTQRIGLTMQFGYPSFQLGLNIAF